MAITDEYRAFATELFGSAQYFNTYRYGCFQTIALDDWLLAAERLCTAVEASGCDQDLCEVSGWLLPLFWFYVRNGIRETGIVDVGCGGGITLWDGALNDFVRTHGIELPSVGPRLPETSVRASCDLLDLPNLRQAIGEAQPQGGFMCCTEVLEHLEFNPLPSLLLVAETFKPDYVYFTAPTHAFPGGFLLPWRHYKELPCCRGQHTGTSMPHTKPWTYAELEELCGDLGYECEGGWWALWRVGILAKKRAWGRP